MIYDGDEYLAKLREEERLQSWHRYRVGWIPRRILGRWRWRETVMRKGLMHMPDFAGYPGEPWWTWEYKELADLASKLRARADAIDYRLGPIPGRDADRIAVELREAADALTKER